MEGICAGAKARAKGQHLTLLARCWGGGAPGAPSGRLTVRRLLLLGLVVHVDHVVLGVCDMMMV